MGALGTSFSYSLSPQESLWGSKHYSPNENVGQSPYPQGLRMGLYLVTGSLPKKSSYKDVIKAALSQCDWYPYKRETVGTERLTKEVMRGYGE